MIDRLDRQMIWITAPAGAGKSQLLQQLADGFAGVSIAMTIEEDDNDAGRLFNRLATAAKLAWPSSSPPTFGPEDVNYLRSFAFRLFEHLMECSREPILVTLDDLQLLNRSPVLLDALAFGVAKTASRVSFAFSSREPPPSSWARFAADGRMGRLGPDALLMDALEVRSLLAAHPEWPHASDDLVVSGLLAATGGWASGLGVAIEFLTAQPHHSRPLALEELRDVVFDNFSDRIFGTFPALERRLLLLLAPSPVLFLEVVREVLGVGACAVLERLHLRNMLVSKEYPDGGRRGPRYRLHSLLRDFLLHRGKTELDPGELRDVSERMARSLLAFGEDDATRELLVEIGDWKPLADHLISAAGPLFACGRILTLARFLNALPDHVREESAELGYWHGICLQQVDLAASRRELTSAYHRFKSREDHANAIQAWGALVDTIWFEWEDCARLDPCIEDLPYLRNAAKALESRDLMAVLTKGALAALSIRRPNHPDFNEWEARNFTLFQRRLPRSETIRRGLQLMIHYVYGSGERRKAEIVRERLHQLFETDTESAADHCVYYVVNAAYQFWFSPDGTASPATVMTGLAVTEGLGLPFWDIPMLNAAMFRLASDEDSDALRNMLALLDERLSADSREHDIAISHHFAAYLAWLEGDNEKALLSMEAACRIAKDSGFCISPVYYDVGHAAVLESLGLRREALRQLSITRREALKQNSSTMQFMVHMAGAAAALHAGHLTFAQAYLLRAFAKGAHERFCAVPWLRLTDRERLCDLAFERGIFPDFVKTLRVAAPSKPELIRTSICTLGRADIRRSNRSELTSRKPQVVPLLLMLHLVAAGPRGKTSDQLIDALWPESDTETGRHRLKTTLYRLRKLVGDQQAVSSTGGAIRIDGSRVEIDAWNVESLIGQKADPIQSCEAVIALYQGGFVDLYSGHPDLVTYREQVARKVERLLLAAGLSLMALEEWDRAAALFESGLLRFGFHDEFSRHLRECFRRTGRTEAVRRLEENPEWGAP
jgi:ATP/maltotriose-dependent transcriptional regulator MalT